MFSFLSFESKESSSTDIPATSAAAGSFFGGMEVQPAVPDDQSTNSGFSFIADNSAQSEFSFLQTPEAPASGFPFLSKDPEHEEGGPSSLFSFMGTVGETDGRSTVEPVSDQEPPSAFTFLSETSCPSEPSTHSGIGQLQHPTDNTINNNARSNIETMDTFKLAKTSLTKQTIKKKRASKVGFGREDEEEDKNPTAVGVSPFPAVSAGITQVCPRIEEEEVQGVQCEAVGEKWGADYSSSRLPQAYAYSSSIPLDVLAAMASAPQPVMASTVPNCSIAELDPAPTQQAPAIVEAPPATCAAVANADDSSGITDTVPIQADKDETAAATPFAPQLAAALPALPAQSRAVATSMSPPAESTAQKLEQRSRESLSQLARGLTDLSRLHSSALESQWRFRQEIDTEAARLRIARSRREEVEQEQARLAQEEDFESADALNAVLEQCAAEARASEGELRSLRVSVRLLEETYAQERADAISNLSRAAGALKVTREQLALGAVQLQKAAEKQYAAEQARITAELERIGLEKGHFEREEQALAEDTARTEEAIRSQTGDLGDRRGALEGAIGAVDNDIRSLQEQLAAKLSERARLAADLDSVEGKIGEVRKKYDRQLQRISDRRAALLQSKSECLDEEATVLGDQKELQVKTEKEHDSALAVRDWTIRLQQDVSVVENLLQILTSVNGGDLNEGANIASISPVDEADDGIAGSAVDALKKNLEAISFLSAKKTATVAELISRRDSLLLDSRRLGEHIPLLEAEKKAHAAAKRFKEAAAVAKELKDQHNAKEAVDSELAASSEEVTHLQSELEQLAAQQEESRLALIEAQRLRDVGRFDCLVQRAQQVHALIAASSRQRIALTCATAPAPAPAYAATGSEVQEAVNAFLSTELAALLREAQAIKELHGLPHSVEDLLVVAESESESDRQRGVDGGAGVDVGGQPASAGGDSAHSTARDDSGDEVGSLDRHTAVTAEDVDGDEASRFGAGPGESVEVAVNPSAETNSESLASEDVIPGVADLSIVEDGISCSKGQAVLFDRVAAVGRAKDTVSLVTQLGSQMDEASDNEDYERAAELFEAITAANVQLEQILVEIGCTRDELARE